MKRRALGKGLGSLLPAREETRAAGGLLWIQVDRIAPNPGQPRESFDDEALGELAESIKAAGVLQPVLVRELGDGYELVAGERRWRAARMAGLDRIPAMLQVADPLRSLELALIENLQRRDLNPIEEARAYSVLISEYKLSQDQVAEKAGMKRSSVANALRLLKLPDRVQALVREGRLTAGHARALLSLPDAASIEAAADAMLREDLSVRQAERMTRAEVATSKPASRSEPPRADPNVHDAEIRLQRALGTKVRIKRQKDGKGRIEIEFYSDDELQRLFEVLEGNSH